MSRAPRPKPVYQPRQRRRGSRLFTGLVSGGLTLLVIGLLLAGVVAFLLNGPGPAANASSVVLRPGAGVTEIGATLKGAGVIRSTPVFVAAAQLSGAARKLKAGEYAFPAKVSQAEVLRKIGAGEVVRHFVTIPEGLTSEMAVEVLAKSTVLTGVAPTPPEGAILPETYEVQRGEDRSAVLQRMMDARDTLLRTLWAQRRSNLPLSRPEDAVTLASVVEKETGVAGERPRIAAVFVNRLRMGMKLQSDPTIIYGLTRGRALGRGIRQSELQRITPYNTYFIEGLPPTPIANPGRAALAAVLSPPDTDELYFVADGTGGHVFASTYEQHAANVARWRQVEASRGVAPSATLGPIPEPPAVDAPATPAPAPAQPEALSPAPNPPVLRQQPGRARSPAASPDAI